MYTASYTQHYNKVALLPLNTFAAQTSSRRSNAQNLKMSAAAHLLSGLGAFLHPMALLAQRLVAPLRCIPATNGDSMINGNAIITHCIRST